MGDKKKHIEDAIVLLEEKITGITRAPLYESKPVGYQEQNNFYNTLIRGQTSLVSGELLSYIKSIEKQIGRKKRFHNGPREIDIDIILYDDININAENLILPHPRMHERDFVLQPFTDIAPGVVHPVLKKTMRELLNVLSGTNRSIVRTV